ncbi:MAG: 50S ribosomal protein L16 [Dehalococcoidia bacterium]|nr:50S ribosomal protein L16 [Dehalococcoidia bacterium]
MLQPSRVKYRMVHRGHVRGKASTGNTLAFGDYGLQALEPAEVSAREIEAARRAIVHHLRRGVMLWIRVFPDKPLTKKPAETRMGSGKGALDHWVAVVKPGKIIFEISGVKEDAARAAFRLAADKLSIQTKVVVKGAD